MPSIRDTRIRRGRDAPTLPDPNGVVILEVIRRAGGSVSRAEITRLTGLVSQTVSDVSQRLLDQGLIAETGKTSSGPGRPSTTLEIVASSRYALGIQIERAAITYVLLDLAGTIVAEHRHEMPADLRPDNIISVMAGTLDDVVEQAGIDRGRVLGLGIATPGPIDIERGIVLDPPHLPGWHRVPLRDRLQAATGLSVFMDKDVIAAAIAEHWFGSAVHSDNVVLVYLGIGIGVGAIVRGSALRGHSSNAGDLGHMIVDADGGLCDCGQRGCFAVVCSPLTLHDQAVAAGVLESGPAVDAVAALGRLGLIADAAQRGDDRALVILRRLAAGLARAVGNIAGLLDSELVVVGGPVWSSLSGPLLDMVRPLANDTFVLGAVHPLRVVGTSVGQDAIAVGAACLVLDGTFTSASLGMAPAWRARLRERVS